MIKRGKLSPIDAANINAPIDPTDIVLSLNCQQETDKNATLDKTQVTLSDGHLGLRIRGMAGFVAYLLQVSRVKNDAIQLWNGGFAVENLEIAHDLPVLYGDHNHADVLHAFAKKAEHPFTFDPVFDGLYIGKAHCKVVCHGDQDKKNGFLFTELCRYLNLILFPNGVTFESNSSAPYFIDMTNGTNVIIGSERHPIDPAKVSNKGIRIGGVKQGAPDSENIVIHAYEGLTIVLGDQAKQATTVITYKKKADEPTVTDSLEKNTMNTNANMKMSKGGVIKLIESEAKKATVYYCQAGVPTLGIGHALGKSEMNAGKLELSDGTIIDFRNDKPISNNEIMLLLQDDLPKYESGVHKVNVPLDQGNFDALVHFSFNVGRGAFLRSSLFRDLNGGHYEVVPGKIKQWKYITKNGKKEVSQGLINRRLKEVSMWHGSAIRGDDMSEWLAQAKAPPSAPANDTLDFFEQAARELLHKKPDEPIYYDDEVATRRQTKPALFPRIDEEQIRADIRQEVEAEIFANTHQAARAEIDIEIEAAKMDAVEAFRDNNQQRWHQSRTNKSIIASFVSAGVSAAVAKYGLGGVFAEPAVAAAATSIITTGLDVAAVVMGGLAIKFRNSAIKFIR